MKMHLVTDLATGQLFAQGRDGRRYTVKEVDDARRQADEGDPDAQAIVECIDVTDVFADRDPREALTQLMHECPECRAEMAAGRRPTFGYGPFHDMLDEPEARPRRENPRRLRWREQRHRR